MLGLAASPKAAAPFLKEQQAARRARLKPRIAQLIKDLNDDQFDVRENAEKELDKIGVASHVRPCALAMAVSPAEPVRLRAYKCCLTSTSKRPPPCRKMCAACGPWRRWNEPVRWRVGGAAGAGEGGVQRRGEGAGRRGGRTAWARKEAGAIMDITQPLPWGRAG